MVDFQFPVDILELDLMALDIEEAVKYTNYPRLCTSCKHTWENPASRGGDNQPCIMCFSWAGVRLYRLIL